MRNVLLIIGAVLCSLALVLAQSATMSSSSSASTTTSVSPLDHDDHDDGGPIQVGYAVVTSSSTSGTTSMAVFETFGLRGGFGTNQAGVLPPGLTTDAILFVDSEGELSKNLGVAIVNPNATNENVTLTLRGSDGTTLGSTTITVPSHQQMSKFVSEIFASQSSVPKDVVGTLVITSTDPVSVIGLRFRGSNFSTIPVTNISGSGSPLPAFGEGVGGPGAVLLPQFAAGGGWATELVIVNTGSSSMTVRVDLFKQDGTPLSTSLNGQPAASSFSNIVIPAGGVFILAPRNSQGTDDF